MKRGFTIIELVLIIVIISVGLFGVLVLFENASRGALEADVDVIATNLAREKIERLLSDRSSFGYDYLNDSNYPVEQLYDFYQGMERTTQINEVSKIDFSTPETGSGFKLVKVTVIWGNSPRERIELSTLLSNYGS